MMNYSDMFDEVYNEQLKYLEESKMKSKKIQDDKKVINLAEVRRSKTG